MTTAITVRPMTVPDIHLAVDWARHEGWNPGLHDAQLFSLADPQGFLMAMHEGEPAACISVVRYGDDYAFLGLYICRPDLRGRGYGMAAWRAGMEYADGRVVGLDGVPAQQANYERSGFAFAWRNIRFERSGSVENTPGAMSDELGDRLLVDLDAVPFQDIASYDQAVFEADRTSFLRSWVAQPGAVRLGVMRDGQLEGWGLMRPCVTRWKIGPLYANDESAGLALLDGLMAAVPGETVFFDVPEPNALAMAAVHARGMTACFETARMYAGAPPDIDLQRVWGITTFELG